MKKSDKYPTANEEQVQSLPPALKILGLHPLLWVLIVVLGVAAARACDNVEELGCDFFEWYEVDDDNEDSQEEDDDEPESKPEDFGPEAVKKSTELD